MEEQTYDPSLRWHDYIPISGVIGYNNRMRRNISLLPNLKGAYLNLILLYTGNLMFVGSLISLAKGIENLVR